MPPKGGEGGISGTIVLNGLEAFLDMRFFSQKAFGAPNTVKYYALITIIIAYGFLLSS